MLSVVVAASTATVYLKEDFSGDCARLPLEPAAGARSLIYRNPCSGRGEPLGCERLELDWKKDTSEAGASIHTPLPKTVSTPESGEATHTALL